MGITCAVTRTTCDTGGGNQDITTADLGGLTPKAALFIISEAVTDGVAANHALLGIGAVTGASNRWSLTAGMENGQASSDTDFVCQNDEVTFITVPGQTNMDGEADFVAFIENGIRINWSNAPGAHLLTVIFFAGTDLSAHADDFVMNAVQNAAVDVTAPGFEPDLLIVASIARSIPSAGTTAEPSIGFVHNDGEGGVTQGCATHRHSNGSSSGGGDGQFFNAYGVAEIDSDGVGDWAGEFGSFDANGFSCTTRLSAGDGDGVMYLALNFGGVVDSWVGVVDAPASTGNSSESSLSFTPQFVLLDETMFTAVNTANNKTAGASAYGLGAFTTTAEYCTSIADEADADPSDTQSISDDVASNVPQDDGSAGFVGTYVSMNNNGWTLNFSAVPGTVRKWNGLAIGADIVTRIPRPPAAYNTLAIY